MRHIDALQDWISRLPDTALLGFLDDYNNLARVSDWLSWLAQNEESWDKLVVHAVKNNNGFRKIRLAHTSPEMADLRLHVWSKGEGSSDFHDHSWNFSSIVLHGVIRHEFLKPVEGEDYCVYHYQSIRPGEFAAYVKGLKSLKLLAAADATPGTTISYDHATVHRAMARTNQAMSLIIRGNLLKSHSDIYLPRTAAKVSRTREIHLTAVELGAHLKLAASALAAIVSTRGR